MPKIEYEAKDFPDWKLDIISEVERIVSTYKAQGYDLTLRQVYYQFVSRDKFPESWKRVVVDGKLIYSPDGSTNNEHSYNNLGTILGDARMAGLLDWESLVDRTRERNKNNHWGSPGEILQAVGNQYQIDKWEGQEYRPEVWVEKDALEGVVGAVAKRLDVPYFSCRGYTSLTSMWQNAQHLVEFAEDGQVPVIFHLGDHDPSGVDMSRDIEDRIRMFMGEEGEKLIFERLALNMDQVRRYRPPENPTKPTDSRSKKYRQKYGMKCWELDALEPSVISDLIENAVAQYRDDDTYEKREAIEAKERGELAKCASKWDSVSKFLGKSK